MSQWYHHKTQTGVSGLGERRQTPIALEAARAARPTDGFGFSSSSSPPCKHVAGQRVFSQHPHMHLCPRAGICTKVPSEPSLSLGAFGTATALCPFHSCIFPPTLSGSWGFQCCRQITPGPYVRATGIVELHESPPPGSWDSWWQATRDGDGWADTVLHRLSPRKPALPASDKPRSRGDREEWKSHQENLFKAIPHYHAAKAKREHASALLMPVHSRELPGEDVQHQRESSTAAKPSPAFALPVFASCLLI